MGGTDLLTRLSTATGPDRQADAEIALLVGWRRQVEGKGDERKIEWVHPDARSVKLPLFTGSIDAAMSLIRLVAPSIAGGVSWAHGDEYTCTAVIEGLPYSHAATIPLAICHAVVQFVQMSRE